MVPGQAGGQGTGMGLPSLRGPSTLLSNPQIVLLLFSALPSCEQKLAVKTYLTMLAEATGLAPASALFARLWESRYVPLLCSETAEATGRAQLCQAASDDLGLGLSCQRIP